MTGILRLGGVTHGDDSAQGKVTGPPPSDDDPAQEFAERVAEKFWILYQTRWWGCNEHSLLRR